MCLVAYSFADAGQGEEILPSVARQASFIFGFSFHVGTMSQAVPFVTVGVDDERFGEFHRESEDFAAEAWR